MGLFGKKEKKEKEPIRRIRRDSKLMKMSSEARSRLRFLLSGGDSYTDILGILWREFPEDEIVQSLTINNVSNYFKHMKPTIDEAKDRVLFMQDASKQFAALLNDPDVSDPMKRVFINLLQHGFVANTNELTGADPIKLAGEYRRMMEVENKNQSLKIQQEKLELDERRVEAMEAKARALQEANERGDSLMSNREIFELAGKSIINILKTYQEGREFLNKFRGQISTRLANEAVRFDPVKEASVNAD